MTRSGLLLATASVLLQVACAPADFDLANESASQDSGSAIGDGNTAGGDTGNDNIGPGLPSECAEVRTGMCASPEGSHSPMWSTNIGSQAAAMLHRESSLAFEMNVIQRARLDKFEVPMAIEGASCDGVVTLRVMVETCPGVFVEIRRMDRPASTMKASSNYWWLNQEPPDLPWMKINQRYRFELTTTSSLCKFRIANLPSGAVRELAAGFTWFAKPGDGSWVEQPGDAVAVPWILRCLG